MALDPSFLRPDVLVLAGGGILGEAWMTGALAGLEDGAGVDFRSVEAFVGTSAGSIVAASLAAGRRPRRPEGVAPAEGGGEAGTDDEAALLRALRLAARWGAALSSPLAPLALQAGAPGGALVRSALLARAPTRGETLGALRRRVEGWGARFDGRLRVVCVDRRSGRRVVFGAPGAPRAQVAEAVEASCSIPWIFEPVSIDGREYVDGGAWSSTNLDVAPATRDTHVLCLNPSASLAAAVASPTVLLRNATRPAAAIEALALRRRGARLETIGPAPEAAELMARSLMDPRPRERVLAAGYRQGLALTGV
jgi:NTE family protein